MLSCQTRSVRLLIGVLGVVIAFVAHAENRYVEWEAYLYGGKYYDSERVGAYALAERPVSTDVSFTGEVLHERYSDYEFSGVGGQVEWSTTPSLMLGLLGSLSRSEYSLGEGFGPSELSDNSQTLSISTELQQDKASFIAQAGRIFNSSFTTDRGFVSLDLYYWGNDYRGYVVAGARRTANFKEYSIEGYRSMSVHTFPVTLYAGATANDVKTAGELRTYHTVYESVYGGLYIDLINLSAPRWSLWLEASRQEGETVLSAELSVAFGPGARLPYISAFDFSQ